MTALVPLTASLTSLLVASSVSEIRLQSEVTVREISGYLRGLSLGTFTAEVRAKSDNRLIGTLSWGTGDVPGSKFVSNLSDFLPTGDSLTFSITSVGVGATDCTVTVWAQ